MGKYMKKSKIAGDVAAVIMDAPSHTPAAASGVRTRAKTLALQKSSPSSPQSPDSSAYLQLRSRRLRKVPPPPRTAANSRLRESSAKTASSQGAEKLGPFIKEEENDVDVAMEGSFGENILEIEGRDRYRVQFLHFFLSVFYSISSSEFFLIVDFVLFLYI